MLTRIAAFELRYQLRSPLFFISFAIFFLLTRFFGAMVVALLLLSSVPLAIMLGSIMPWLNPDKVGPFVAANYVYALFVFGLPTLLVMGAGFFAMAVATRSLMWTYVGAVAFFVLYFTSLTLLRDPTYDHLTALLDPFGDSTLDLVTKYWTAAERNSQLPPLRGILLENRLIWLGLATALFVLAYLVFRFEATDNSRRRKSAASAKVAAPAAGLPLQGVQPVAGRSWQAFLSLTRFDIGGVLKSPAFFVLLAIGVLNACGALLGTVTQDDISYFPVTRAAITRLQGAYSFIPLIIAIYYSGELIWRDRETRIHEIVDAYRVAGSRRIHLLQHECSERLCDPHPARRRPISG